MNLAFSQLEKARRNPKRFAHSLVAGGGGGGNGRNFTTYLAAALKEFHQGRPQAVVLKNFEKTCKTELQHQQYFAVRLDRYLGTLKIYCETFAAQACHVVELKKRVRLALGPHRMSGLVSRFDLIKNNRYRCTSLQLHTGNWYQELRWPLLQKGLAVELGCAESEIEVGIYCFETGVYAYGTYSAKQIAAAVAETKSILDAIEANRPEVEFVL